MPKGAEDIGDIYQLRTLRPKGEIAARLATVIGPAEELYWRGLVQAELARRLGPGRGAAAAAVIYGGAHVATGNATLVGAASVAGGVWSALAARGVPMPALIVSHVVWDIWIFLVQPTQPVDDPDRSACPAAGEPPAQSSTTDRKPSTIPTTVTSMAIFHRRSCRPRATSPSTMPRTPKMSQEMTNARIPQAIVM
jgi:hypothetical protein